MLKLISDLAMKAHIALTGLVRDFKKDERGLSGVVVAILLILVAVLAIVLIWGLLDGWLKDIWDRIVKGTDKIE